MTETAAPPSPVRRPFIALAAGATLTLATVAVAVLASVDWRTFVDSYTFTNLVIGSGFFTAGLTIAWFRPGHVIGRLLQGSGLAYLLSAAATPLALFGLASGWPEPVVRTLSTVTIGAWQIGLACLLPLALLLYPDGRLPGRRWRVVVWLLLIAGGYQAVTGVLSDGTSFSDAPGARSILSVGLDLPAPVNEVMGWLYTAVDLAVIGSLVVRFVRGDERVKRQLLWLILALVCILVVNAQRFVTADGPILLLLSFLFIPAAIAIAIVRYQLFDIRLVLSRTLLYTLMVALIIAAYAGIVAGLSLLVPADAQRRVSIAAAIVVAIVFNPLRLSLQRLLDRAFYGTRSDPLGTVAHVGRRLRHDDDLAAVLEGVRAALQLPWLGLRQGTGAGAVVEVGVPDGSPRVELALTYRGADQGALLVGLRRGESRLHDADRRAMDVIATPLALALHATALSEEVRAARAAAVESAAAEQVRLQRELHDGLGPTLTSVAFRADAASNLVGTDSEQAGRLLHDIGVDVRGAIDSVRRVVYGLRPIELDDLGLVGALRQKATALADASRNLAVDLAVVDTLPSLSPAIELAAYRIATEAVTNVVRHSDGHVCRISVDAGDDLIITVTDDGEPPARWHPGVGIRSIAERAEELGGSADVGPVPGGWQVSARIPLTGISHQQAAIGTTAADQRRTL